jgi:putative DNA primase/helicase
MDTMLALKSLTLLPSEIEPPCWLDGDGPFPANEVVPCRNALVHLPSVVDLLPCRRPLNGEIDASEAAITPTPRFFCTYALDFDFDLDAPVPVEWLKFLLSIWSDDPESIDVLQEWFGYCLLTDTSQHKILTLIGPTRSGRGTIARVLRALVGPENTAAPTLASLATPFGAAPLIGKPLAIIADARLGGRTDSSAIVERLLSISGEDTQTIDRKYNSAWTGKLPTRFVLISNELPKVRDASGAFAGRLILLRFTNSFYGHEDHGMLRRLVPELPGILLWAIEGWRRLRDRGHFVQPKSGANLVESLEELASPITAFIRERLELAPGVETEVQALFAAWCDWCHEAGRRDAGSVQTFGRDLVAACPHVTTGRPRRRAPDGSGERKRVYRGIKLR